MYFYFHWCLHFSLYSYTHLTLFNTATFALPLLHCYICTLNPSHHLTFRSLSSWPRMSLSINGRLMTLRHDHFMTKCGSVLGLSGPAHYRSALLWVYLLYIGLLYRMGLLLYRIGLLLYMGLARVIRAGWAPRNHCWVTSCLTTSLKYTSAL